MQDVGSGGKRLRTYSRTPEGQSLKKSSRVKVAFKEDDCFDNIMNFGKKKLIRGNGKEEAGKSTENSEEQNLFLFQSRSRGKVGELGHGGKKRRGKAEGSAEDVTPKRPKKLPLAPASKSPTEEDCSYGWQQSCWRCTRRSAQLRLCSACQVYILTLKR